MSASRTLAALAAIVLATDAHPHAAPVLRTADARVVFQSPTACRVDLTLQVDGAAEVEHRLALAEGGRVDLTEIRGATRAGDVHIIGATSSLLLRPDASAYTVRYTVALPPERSHRCPLWIPTVPTEGRGPAVRLVVRIPAGATPAGTMPAFTWSAEEGTTTIGHLPAFVRVPFAMPGTPAPWDIAFIMDAVSIVTLAVATLAWARSRRRGSSDSRGRG